MSSSTDPGLAVVAATSAEWADARWVRILDRIEHRQPEVGLRFWGPPLWLEVTMTGPDSDRWPVVTDEAPAWDWQSAASCTEAAALAAEGADDDRILAAVARYTIENLILNAAHEIGEWFRFDGRRPFPAHRPRVEAGAGSDAQGNGSVSLHVDFSGRPAARDEVADRGDAPLAARMDEVAAPSRFTYLPGTAILYEPGGPVVRRWSEPPSAPGPICRWSSRTLHAVEDHDPTSVEWIVRDVHRAAVLHEADRICRAFHVDGTRPWSLDATPAAGEGILSIVVDHADDLADVTGTGAGSS